jgi:type IV pilus assembly protein PilE
MSNVRRMQGITLIELLVVIVVVAILASISTSTYRSYLVRTNRTEARMALLRVQAAQEKYFLQNNEYADDDKLTTAPPGGLGVPATTQSGYYTITVNRDTTTSYTATATAINGQAKDDEDCPVLSIDNEGSKLPTGKTCWR